MGFARPCRDAAAAGPSSTSPFPRIVLMASPVPADVASAPSPAADTDAPTGRAAEPAGVRLLVTRLTVVLNRRRAYDATHPMVRQAEEALLDSVRSVLGATRSIALGVAHRELLVDGLPFPQGGAAAHELAERLHRRSVGAVTLDGRTAIDGLRTAITWLAIDPGTSAGSAAGHGSPPDEDRRGRGMAADPPPEVVGFQIARVPFDRLALQLRADERLRDLRALWRSLAQAALDAPAGDAADEEVAPDVLAHAIDQASGDPHRVEKVGFLLNRMALELRDVPPDVRHEVALRLRDLLLRLQQSSLVAIVEALGDDDTRHRFTTTLVDVLPASAVVEWLERTVSMTEQQLSHHLVRILAKLSTVAGDAHPASRVSSEFRDAARRLIDEWTLADPNPVEHDALLDFIAVESRAPTGAPPMSPSMTPAPDDLSAGSLDALRLVQMACELDVVGEDTRLAAQRLAEEGRHRLLLDVIAAAPGPRAPVALGDVVVSPAALQRVVLGTPFDAADARRLLAHARLTHAPLLLEALAVAEQRSARRVLLGTLRDLGPGLLPLLVRQLDPGAAWYYLRNVLVLLRDLLAEAGPDAPERMRAPLFLSFLDHVKSQVRVEALRLALDLPSSRSIGLLRALDDQSSRVVAVAIDALLAFAADDGLAASVASETDALAQRLALLVDEHRFEPEVLARAVRAMQIDASTGTRDWLLGHVTRRSRFLRRLRLAEGRPTVLAALRVLTVRHGEHPAVEAVVAQAAQCEPGDLRRKVVEQALIERRARSWPPLATAARGVAPAGPGRATSTPEVAA